MKYLLSTCALLVMCISSAQSAEELSRPPNATGCQIWGRVIAPPSAMASGVRIELVREKPAKPQKTTAANGTFNFSAVPAGLYQFRVFDRQGTLLLTQSQKLQGDHDYVVIAFPISQRLGFATRMISAAWLAHRTPEGAAAAMKRGVKAAQSGEVEKSIEQFQKAAELDPRYAESEVNLAIQYSKLQNTDMALAHARQAYSLDPDFPGSWYTLGTLLLTYGHYHDAETVLREAIRKYNESGELHGMLAAALINENMPEEGLKQLKYAVAECPIARLWASRAFASKGMITEAVIQVKQYIRDSASECERADLQGWINQFPSDKQ